MLARAMSTCLVSKDTIGYRICDYAVFAPQHSLPRLLLLQTALSSAACLPGDDGVELAFARILTVNPLRFGRSST